MVACKPFIVGQLQKLSLRQNMDFVAYVGNVIVTDQLILGNHSKVLLLLLNHKFLLVSLSLTSLQLSSLPMLANKERNS